MLTRKANSKRKCVKKMQEHETGMLSLCNFADSEILADSEHVPDRFR